MYEVRDRYNCLRNVTPWREEAMQEAEMIPGGVVIFNLQLVYDVVICEGCNEEDCCCFAPMGGT